ncbi:peptidoglycan editing factor PgeF [Candidatus Puniceispirillum sp.]|nr:peptidoglycan editing factor PgeF [Candidatus Puniceispirillum sp.]
MTLNKPISIVPCFQHQQWQKKRESGLQIRHGFFTAGGGVSSGLYKSLNCGFGSNDDQLLIAKNRKLVATSLGFSSNQMVGLRQVHSATSILIDAESDKRIDERAEADAMVTRTPNIALSILTADCVPVLFVAPSFGLVGAAHAGWRGAVNGVLESTIAMMVKLGAKPQQIEAVIGPAIQQASYQVGSDLRDYVLKYHSDAEIYFESDVNRKYRFDLPGFIKWRLNLAGLLQIENLGIDTYGESSNLFSHRKATHAALNDTGRQISVIGLLSEHLTEATQKDHL